jgi:UPF0176 protein
VPASNYEAFRTALYQSAPELNGIRMNIALEDDGKSFWALRLKVRPKIVADGIDDPDFDPAKTGKYLKAREYNELSSKPDTIIVDMRNHYEYRGWRF